MALEYIDRVAAELWASHLRRRLQQVRADGAGLVRSCAAASGDEERWSDLLSSALRALSEPAYEPRTGPVESFLKAQRDAVSLLDGHLPMSAGSGSRTWNTPVADHLPEALAFVMRQPLLIHTVGSGTMQVEIAGPQSLLDEWLEGKCQPLRILRTAIRFGCDRFDALVPQ
eukprot:m.266245 g.266245  ORF g.266245 m.266245 type:complete len:171 (+) comp19272_c1_seq12:1987-2499(+)